eukprot:5578360-Pyramimonas_sp.AAC.1
MKAHAPATLTAVISPLAWVAPPPRVSRCGAAPCIAAAVADDVDPPPPEADPAPGSAAKPVEGAEEDPMRPIR